MKLYNWISVNDELPKPLQTVWLTNGFGWVTLGCLVENEDGWHWAESNGIIYGDKDKIMTECESEDLDVKYWHDVPDLPNDLSNLAKFCKKIAKQEDCPPEFIEIVNKEFWNLI